MFSIDNVSPIAGLMIVAVYAECIQEEKISKKHS